MREEREIRNSGKLFIALSLKAHDAMTSQQKRAGDDMWCFGAGIPTSPTHTKFLFIRNSNLVPSGPNYKQPYFRAGLVIADAVTILMTL